MAKRRAIPSRDCRCSVFFFQAEDGIRDLTVTGVQTCALAYADSLKGHFLLVHGTGDDNVHFQNSVRLVERLEAANRQFDMRIYPNKTHAIAGGDTREELYRLFPTWVREKPQRAPPPPVR